MIGGEHERWEVPARVTAEEELGWDSDEDGRPKKEHGQAPKVCQLKQLGVQASGTGSGANSYVFKTWHIRTKH